MTNLELFKYSCANPEPMYDPYYTGNMIVIPTTNLETNALTLANVELIKLISAYDLLRSKIGKEANACRDEIIGDVMKLLDNTKHINFTPFVQFFMTKNANYALYKKYNKEQKVDFVRKMLKLFCEERHSMYLSHGYANTTLQVVCDNYSHKRNCKTTIKKIEDMLSPYGYTKTSSAKFKSTERHYILPDKSSKGLFAEFVRRFNLKFEAAKKEQGKLPDMVFNVGVDLYVMEMKSMKLSGGGQNHQASEIVNFIKYSEADPHVHYLTFLDSDYANDFFAQVSPKHAAQYKDAYENLKAQRGNYFLNTAGFEKFLEAQLQK